MNKLLQLLKNIRLPRLNLRFPDLRRLGVARIVIGVLALVLAVGVFIAIQNFTTCWRITELPGIPPASCSGTPVNALGTPVLTAQGTAPADVPPPPDASAPEVQYPQWDGGSRINIALFGLRGGTDQCPLCTDTIMVLTVDPISKTAGMMSIPRDTFVAIPGCGGCQGLVGGYGRINQAWTYGAGLNMPGGGPGEAMKAVSQLLGVPIQYYVQIDFDTFVQFINMLHGIDVYNNEDLRLKKLGGGQDVIKLTCCGIRHLNGDAALAYARCRDVDQGCSDGDVGRAYRQQQVILGVRARVLNPSRFPDLMAQAPQLYNTFSSGIHTNMDLQSAIKLAALVSQIPADKIKQGVIDDKMLIPANVTLGGQNAAVSMPIPDKIRVLRDQIFSVGGPTSPMAQGDPRALMQADAARVVVVNDSYTAGLDSRTAKFLQDQGMQVIGLGPATGALNQTMVVIYSPKLYAFRYLIQPLGMIGSSGQIFFKPDPNAPADLEIRLGNDWASRLPAGY